MDTAAAGSIELRALVVDDNPEAATSLSYLLQHLGWRTAIGFGQVTALAVGRLFQPHVVFLDLNLPGADGREILSGLKACGTPISDAVYVCLTGSNDPDDEAACLSAGFDYFIKKPIESASLEHILDAATARAAQQSLRAGGS